MKAQVFTIEALIALLIAASFVAMQPVPQAIDFNNVYRYQLAQDFLEVSVKNQNTLVEIRDFANGDSNAKTFLENKYSALLASLGDYCLELKAKNQMLQANCANQKNIWVSATRVVYDGNDFFELTLRLGFDS
ncbi:MAG: hypothetical protein V1811_01310 [Candidatus Micrarchaeota archaeon]